MQSIPLSTKKVLFNKGIDESLTPDEQALWEEIVEWENPENARVDPDDPLFKEALRLYVQLEKEDIAPTEKLYQAILQETEPVAISKPVKNRIWLLTKWVTAASIVLIVGFYIWSQHKSDQSTLVTTQAPANQVQVFTLPDGTLVLLNKDSRITYPETFAANERRVELSGEAFFVVKHNSTKPFQVVVGNTTITDLGTKFNIRGYAYESSVITTVKEGKVKIKGPAGEKVIHSGQQAIATADSFHVLQPGNIDSTMTWKNQYIYLEDRSTRSVMEQIHKYYGIEYKIPDSLPSLGLKGQISIENPLDSTIKFLNDAARKVSFRIQGRKVVVTKKVKNR